ncbi:MAG: T9SS C-terminal target domain-containing protein, partial [Saprospirales bacterium]
DVDLRVICEPPNWNINPANFSFSMNFTLELNIEGELSTDRLDHIGAFVDGELRGLGYVQYNVGLDKYLVFLTVYSNDAQGEEISFRIWDATACLLYGPTTETYQFVADETIGSPNQPEIIYTQNLLIRLVHFNSGWNWFSYNLELPDSGLDSALASLTNPMNALIKGQTAFSTYSGATQSWIGNLLELSHLTMYQYKSAVRDSLVVVGMGVDPSTPIGIAQGWNWVGYLPQRSLPLNQALSSLDPLNGDIIKSQTNFAQYVAGLGWVGNLDFMSPLNGYLLRIGNSGTLIFPQVLDLQADLNTRSVPEMDVQLQQDWISGIHVEEKPFDYWEVNPQDYELTMNTIGIVLGEGENNILSDGDEVAAFYNDEVRGSGQAMYIEALDRYMLFITIYSNREGELMHFKFYNSQSGEVHNLKETVHFASNQLIGEVEMPFEFTFILSSTENELLTESNLFSVHPNPSRGVVYFNFHSDGADRVKISIMDSRGAKVGGIQSETIDGRNTVEWDAGLHLPQGLYVIVLKDKWGVHTRKLLIKR